MVARAPAGQAAIGLLGSGGPGEGGSPSVTGVAIILPEGVFANSNLRYVREWLVENFTLRAVVGLPRDTFKDAGTTAKTAILYLEKRRPPEGHQVLLAEVGQINPNGQPNLELGTVVTALQEGRQGFAKAVWDTGPRGV